MHYIGVAIAAFSLVPYLFVKQTPPGQATEEEKKSIEMKNKKKADVDVSTGTKGAAAATDAVDCEKGNAQPRHGSEDTLTSTHSSDLQISPSGNFRFPHPHVHYKLLPLVQYVLLFLIRYAVCGVFFFSFLGVYWRMY